MSLQSRPAAEEVVQPATLAKASSMEIRSTRGVRSLIILIAASPSRWDFVAALAPSIQPSPHVGVDSDPHISHRNCSTSLEQQAPSPLETVIADAVITVRSLVRIRLARVRQATPILGVYSDFSCANWLSTIAAASELRTTRCDVGGGRRAQGPRAATHPWKGLPCFCKLPSTRLSTWPLCPG